MRPICGNRAFSPLLVTFILSIATGVATARADPTCTFDSKVAVADGQAQTVNISGCTETASGTGPLGSTLQGNMTLSDGKVTAKEQATAAPSGGGGAMLDFGGMAATNVNASFSDVGRSILNFFGSSPSIGGVQYNLSTVALDLKGTAKATVNNGNQANGAYIDFVVGDNVKDFVVNNQTQTPSSPQMGSKDIGPCGLPSGSVCPGVNQAFLVATNLTVPKGASALDFELDLSGRFALTTGLPGAGASIDASDPFEIDTMALVDANGTVIPGITFTADDGFVFPSELATVPAPDIGRFLAIGYAGVLAAGWWQHARRSRARVGRAALP